MQRADQARSTGVREVGTGDSSGSEVEVACDGDVELGQFPVDKSARGFIAGYVGTTIYPVCGLASWPLLEARSILPGEQFLT